MRRRIVVPIVLAIVSAGCFPSPPQEYRSPDGQFRVTFPAKPVEKNETKVSPLGAVPTRIVAYKTFSRTEKGVATLDFLRGAIGPAVIEQKIDALCDAWALDNKLEVTGRVSRPYNHHPGRELTFKSRPEHAQGQLSGRGRFFMTENRLYIIYAIGAPGRLSAEEIDGFLNSFELLGEGYGWGEPTAVADTSAGLIQPPVDPQGIPGPMQPGLNNPQPPGMPGMPAMPRMVPGPMGPMGPMGPQGLNIPRPPHLRGPRGFGPNFPTLPGGPRGPNFRRIPGGPRGFPGNPGAPVGPSMPGQVDPNNGPGPSPVLPQAPVPRPFQPAPMPVPQPLPAQAPRAEPAPERSRRGLLALYTIPEPATAEIKAEGADRVGESSAGGAVLRSFRWLDEDSDRIGGSEPGPGGAKDQHFRLELVLPETALVLSMTITGGDSHRWSTRPGDSGGPIAIERGGLPVARAYVEQLGVFSGPDPFELFVEGGADGGKPGTFEIEVVVGLGDRQVTLSGRCDRPARAVVEPIVEVVPPKKVEEVPSSPRLIPIEPKPPLREKMDPRPGPQAAAPAVPRPLPGDRAAELPASITPSGGGATIRSFAWVGRDDDYVGSDAPRVGPGGAQDDHFRLEIELPAAAVIEEVAILGGEVRWTTKPLPRSWPLAVVVNQVLKNHRQMYRLGPYSGRWNLDLYVEPQGETSRGQPFAVEIVVSVRGTRYRLTARCEHP